MSRVSRCFLLMACISLYLSVSLLAQSAAPQTSSANPVPTVVKYSGLVNGAPSRIVGITFALYKDEQGGAALWLETQSVGLDATGHYSVQLGSTQPLGLPIEVFASGEARWLGVQIEGRAEQPRVLLLSVPYALKAADAETLGGLPASAFALALPASAAPPAAAGTTSINATAPPPTAPVTGTGTVNYVPLWDTASDIVSSVIFQTGAGAGANIGINTASPAVTLDVNGASTIHGTLALPATGVATPATGKNSQPLSLTGSVFNSASGAAVNQNFLLQTEPSGNNTAGASGKLNLLYASGTNAPAETGFSIASNGQMTFVPGQAFPGTGTITGVNAGTGLTGGGTSGTITLSIDTTTIPQLASSNTFSGIQTVNGNLNATGSVSASVFEIGSTVFAFGSSGTRNAFLGFAGNPATTGVDNTATGYGALSSDSTGADNTATGFFALFNNFTGNYNTATGWDALFANNGIGNTASGFSALVNNTTGYNNVADGVDALSSNTTGGNNTASGTLALFNNATGVNNTALGYNAGPDSGHTNLSNSTAIGALAQVTASNSLVLGSINGVNGATADALVGIGNTAPSSTLDVEGTAAAASGPIFFLKNKAAIASGATGNAIDLRFAPDGGSSVSNPNAYIRVREDGSGQYGAFMSFATMADGGAGSGALERMRIAANGFVGVGVASPAHIFQVGQGLGNAFADGWSTYSSRRWKTNIKTLPHALAKVEQLRGVSYDLKDNGKHEIGVIAEEVGQVVPEIVSFDANGKDAQGVDYSRLTALLIEATKEQQKELRQQQTALAEALRQIKQQQSLLRAQRSAMRNMEAEIRETRETVRRVKAQVGIAQTALVAAK